MTLIASQAEVEYLGRPSDELPLIRYDGSGYRFAGQEYEGFADQPQLSDPARLMIARFARAYTPKQLSGAQKQLLQRFDKRRPAPSALLQAFAADESDVALAFRAGLYDDLSTDEMELVRDPRKHPELEGRDYPLSIGEVASLAGASEDKIRHWEERGLLKSYRLNGGKRRFFRGAVARVFILLKAEQYELATLSRLASEGPERFIRLLTLAMVDRPDPATIPERASEFVSAARLLIERLPDAANERAQLRAALLEPLQNQPAAKRPAKPNPNVRFAVEPGLGAKWEVVQEEPIMESANKQDAIKKARWLAARTGIKSVLVHNKRQSTRKLALAKA